MSFVETRWTTVLRAGQPNGSEAEAALSRLCEDYRPPLLQFARLSFKTAEEAEDVTQNFLFHFIKNNLAKDRSPARGRFRTFLLSCFQNFIRDEFRRRKRKREIPEAMLSSLDGNEDGESIVPDSSSDSVEVTGIDYFWATSIHDRVLTRIRADYIRRGKDALFTALVPFLIGSEGRVALSCTEIAQELNISKAAVKTEMFRLRMRYRNEFRTDVAQTIGPHVDVEGEFKYLITLVVTQGGSIA